ncbi:MAG: helix-turn-helix transcriptional regulator [Solirubrobacterales bacterium]|nr:helix-turn-helix transcriptional regulator [Solirubrobacterales bacterium]
MSAKYAILGLVIERPGYGYQLAQRLEERFGSSSFAPSGVYSALDQLSRDGFVHAAREAGPIPARRAAPRMIYEASSEGVEHFEAWMLGSSPTPPLRDELHMKIALCRPRNIPRLIDMVYGQKLACAARLRELERLAETQAEEHSDEWVRQMRVLATATEMASWRARIEWLQSARELLETITETSRRPPNEAPRAAPGRRLLTARAL